jgi:hypothetical protein
LERDINNEIDRVFKLLKNKERKSDQVIRNKISDKKLENLILISKMKRKVEGFKERKIC